VVIVSVYSRPSIIVYFVSVSVNVKVLDGATVTVVVLSSITE
jgi:hypothetical protein